MKTPTRILAACFAAALFATAADGCEPACTEASCAPRTDLPGWNHTFADDFTVDVVAGDFVNSFPGDPGEWGAYPDGWFDSSRRGIYTPSAIYADEGFLRLPVRTVDGQPRVAAVAPVPEGATGPYGGQLYGRWAIRLRADNAAAGYKLASLLWPDSDVWPRDGEIDFPEAELTGNVHAFTHFQGATVGSDQDAFPTDFVLTDWHTYVIEWTPTSVTYFVDDVEIGRSTERIPNTVMHLVVQAETNLSGSPIPPTSAAEIQIDWVSIWEQS